MISQKKHERFLYTLLSIYTLLVMIFMLLLNGFFVKPKAFTDGFSYTLSGTTHIKSDNLDFSSSRIYTSNGRTTNIFYKDQELSDLINEHLETGQQCIFISFGYHNRNEHSTGTLTYTDENYNPNQRSFTYTNTESMSQGNYIYDYLVSKGVTLPEYYYPILCSYFVIGEHGDYVTNISLDTDIEYVENPQDLYDYLINGNDDVLKEGDPYNPELPEDDSLPIPQKLGTDIQNDNVGTPPFISGSWENPGSIYASFDASEVKVEIQYKPVFQLYKKIFNLKLAKVSASDWIPVTETQISNYTFNRFILYNAKTGYPQPFDSQTLHSGSLTDDIETIGNSSGYTDMFNPISARIANGTNWRIRYVVGNRTSLWVVFHVNSVGSLKNEESVSFENASGDSVAADDVNYTNSAQTSTVDKLNVNNFFDSLSSAINGIFNTTNNSFTAQDTEGSKGFYAMFKATFDKFPVFWTFFCLGLIVAILLRILGR